MEKQAIQSVQQTAWSRATYLMFHVMLHVNVTTSKNFETEGTEQVFGVLVDIAEMSLHIWEERRAVIADLRNERNRMLVAVNTFSGTLIEPRLGATRQTWHTYGISPGLWLSFMCSSRTCSDSNASSHILQLAGEKRRKFRLGFWVLHHADFVETLFTYLRIRLGCERSRCGTAAGTESCTAGSNAGKLCGFPSSRCSAFPAPGGASYGSWTCERG